MNAIRFVFECLAALCAVPFISKLLFLVLPLGFTKEDDDTVKALAAFLMVGLVIGLLASFMVTRGRTLGLW